MYIIPHNVLRDSVAKTLFLTHPNCQLHKTGPGHPEKPERLKAILKAIESPQFSGLLRGDAIHCDVSTLKLVHAPEMIDNIFNHPDFKNCKDINELKEKIKEVENLNNRKEK